MRKPLARARVSKPSNGGDLFLGLRRLRLRRIFRRGDALFGWFRGPRGQDGDPLLAEPVLLLPDPGLFTGHLAEEEELRPADVPPLLHFDPLEEGGVQRERPLHAHSVRLLADLEGCGGSVAVKPDDDPLEVLDALLFPFPDPQVDAHRVPGLERRKVAAKLRFFQFPEEIAHFSNPFPESVPFGKQDGLIYSTPPPGVNFFFPRSGRLARVLRVPSSRRHFSIAAWLPDRSTSGTVSPRNSRGRVYCGPSRIPSSKESLCGAKGSPITPGTNRATASTSTRAGSSPPGSTQSPMEISKSARWSVTGWSTHSNGPKMRIRCSSPASRRASRWVNSSPWGERRTAFPGPNRFRIASTPVKIRSGFITIPPPPPKGGSSVTRCFPCAYSRRSCPSTASSPASLARARMLWSSGPAKIPGKSVKMSTRILPPLRGGHHDAASGDVDLADELGNHRKEGFPVLAPDDDPVVGGALLHADDLPDADPRGGHHFAADQGHGVV